jgi:hypothetical protein
MTNLQKKSSFKAFFEELYHRLKSESPAFFKIIQKFSAFIGSAAGLAIILQGFAGRLPEVVNAVADWTVLIGAVLTYIVAKLPVADKEQQVEEQKLPYTEKQEAKGK